MVAGKLTEIISFNRLKSEINEYFEEETKCYFPYCQTRAQVIYEGDTKMELVDEITFVNNITFIVRYYHKNHLSKLDRIAFKEEMYEIMEIIEDKEAQLLRLKCKLVNE